MRQRSSYFWEFVKLTRPLFLMGGVILNLLGTAAALLDGALFSLNRFLLGQALITSVQLMTHYANEYYDIETDRLNAHRTWFSGGSGVLVRGSLPPASARTAAILFAFSGICFMVAAGAQVWQVWIPGLTALGLAWSYSGPPFTLVKTGWGELSASLVVAGLVPVVGYLMQSGGFLRATILAPLLPLILLHFAMLIAFQIPDREADQASGKRTVAVRLNLPKVVRLHNISLLGAFCVILALAFIRWPGAQAAWLPIPVALWQAVSARRLVQGEQVLRYHWLTTRALFLFALTAALWLAGVAVDWIQ
jgi:1,4-dihydroxy-2-naphthoate octaprenyltransferase